MQKCTELLQTLGRLWPSIDIIILAQNWRNYQPPEIPNNISIRRSPIKRLGICSARKVLRQEFLDSEYDCLIMLDDDTNIKCDDPVAYIKELDDHPNSVIMTETTLNPLHMFAIPKQLYSQVDIPDVIRERGDGLEDFVFAAECKARFPDQIVYIPISILDVSADKFLNNCPSTWASERPVDWEQLARATDSLIASVNRTASVASVETAPIDIVLPFVNPNDPEWLSALSVTRPDIQTENSSRFRSLGTLKYLLRGISEYMPFIRNVVLVVSTESQIPDWLNTEQVRIVCHRDFIPEEFLPTFNCCTIDSFLGNIPDLAEYIIYFNDDIFPVSPMTASDFFTEGKPHLCFTEHESYVSGRVFFDECRVGLDMVTDLLRVPRYPAGELIAPGHTAFPITRATLEVFKDDCDEQIRSTITQFRAAKNANQYIYHYYHYFLGEYINDCCAYTYIETKHDADAFRHCMFDKHFQLVCLNDTQQTNDFNTRKQKLLEVFEEKFPNKCRFEL